MAEVRRGGFALDCALESPRMGREVALAAVHQHEHALNCAASAGLITDREVVLTAV